MNKNQFVLLLLGFILFVYTGCYIPLYALGAEENITASVDENMTEWDKKYKNAPVVRLLYDRHLEINEDFSYSEEVHSVLKIQNERGKEVGNLPIHYNSETDVVEYVHAYTITPEGNRIECTQINDRSAYEGFNALSEHRVKLFTMPQVVAGSLLEFKFKIIYKKPAIADNFFTSSSITSTIPVNLTRIKIILPNNMKLYFRNQNTDIQPRIIQKGNKIEYLWETKEKETEPVENSMPGISEVCQKVYISSFKSWDQLAEVAWGLFNKNIIVSEDIKVKVKEITTNDESVREKIQSVIEYIQKECRYITMSMDSHHFEPHPSYEVFSNKYGDCKDQTILALAMLKEIGINAYPALFTKTYDPGFKNRLPMPSFFNHVIFCIEYEGAKYFTDVLIKGFYFDEIPYDLAGAYVLVLNGEGGSLERVPESDPASYMRKSDFKININEDGSTLFDGSVTFPRRQSLMMRRSYLNSPPDKREKMLSSFAASYAKGGTMLDRKINNIDDPYQNIRVDLKYKRPDIVQIVNDMMIFGIGKINPPSFPPGKRKHPLIITPAINNIESNYIIPEGYEVLNLPKDIHVSTEYISYDRVYKQNNREIKVIDILNYKLAWLKPESYNELLDVFNEIRNATNSSIVIKKQ